VHLDDPIPTFLRKEDLKGERRRKGEKRPDLTIAFFTSYLPRERRKQSKKKGKKNGEERAHPKFFSPDSFQKKIGRRGEKKKRRGVV